jgi:hypothetical protein
VALSAGTRLGPYTITAPLGAGGMGEVVLSENWVVLFRCGRYAAAR